MTPTPTWGRPAEGCLPSFPHLLFPLLPSLRPGRCCWRRITPLRAGQRRTPSPGPRCCRCCSTQARLRRLHLLLQQAAPPAVWSAACLRCPCCLHRAPALLILEACAAARHSWGGRLPLLFFRGAATGDRNVTDPELSRAFPEVMDVQVSFSLCAVSLQIPQARLLLLRGVTLVLRHETRPVTCSGLSLTFRRAAVYERLCCPVAGRLGRPRRGGVLCLSGSPLPLQSPAAPARQCVRRQERACDASQLSAKLSACIKCTLLPVRPWLQAA